MEAFCQVSVILAKPQVLANGSRNAATSCLSSAVVKEKIDFELY